MPDDAIGEAVADAAGVVMTYAGGFVVDLAIAYIFSGHTARFFHAIGRRVIAIATLGRTRIPSSLRSVPQGVRPRPRRSDWLALWVGVAVWTALFVALIFTGASLL